jgi:hypothetical protein
MGAFSFKLSDVFPLVGRPTAMAAAAAAPGGHLCHAGPHGAGAPHVAANMANHGGQAAGDGPGLPGRVPVQGYGGRARPRAAQAQQAVQVQGRVQPPPPAATADGVLLRGGEKDKTKGGEAGAAYDQDGIHAEQDEKAAEGSCIAPGSRYRGSEAN